MGTVPHPPSLIPRRAAAQLQPRLPAQAREWSRPGGLSRRPGQRRWTDPRALPLHPILETRSRGHGVVVCSGSKLHRIRFLVPSPAADPVSSLRLAGASLAYLIYPSCFYEQLQAVWSSLVAAAPVTVPPRATHVEVTIDVGILRPEDRTGWRTCSRQCRRWRHGAAPSGAGARCDVDATRPAKRRKVAGEKCPICYEVFERVVAAWPGCSHVFHSRCLEQLLVTVKQCCPLCRSENPPLE
ncbi:uncharacterized protein LOC133900157 [Phragmites australis]|uniref:uncharacterized protein LOC133900157 n=1 Tax=Phragmites australis TaxID=29695 RepID=UPI002D78FCDC|nr:uncharacterized protein LOC133900157 [Phragmites australis]